MRMRKGGRFFLFPFRGGKEVESVSVVNPARPKPKGKHASQGGWKRQAAYLTMVLPGVVFLLMFAYIHSVFRTLDP